MVLRHRHEDWRAAVQRPARFEGGCSTGAGNSFRVVRHPRRSTGASRKRLAATMQQLNLSHWHALQNEPERYAEYRRRVIHQMAQGVDRDQAEKLVFRQMEREREKMN